MRIKNTIKNLNASLLGDTLISNGNMNLNQVDLKNVKYCLRYIWGMLDDKDFVLRTKSLMSPTQRKDLSSYNKFKENYDTIRDRISDAF